MVYVMSRAEVENWYKEHPSDTTPIISINDIGYDSPVPEGHPNALRLWFDDVSPFFVKHDLHHPYYKEQAKERELVFFDDEMAKQVLDFLFDIHYKRESNLFTYCKSNLFIHCYAGISRSVAIALFVRMVYGFVFGKVHGVDYNNCRMNTYVFGKLLKCNEGEY